MFKLSIIVLTLLVTVKSYAEYNSSYLNEIKTNIEQTKTIMLQGLSKSNLNTANLTPNQIQLISKYKDNFYQELLRLNIKYINDQSRSFLHFNQETNFETDIAPFGEIRIRNLEEIINTESFGPQYLIRYLGHEIGHHLLAQITTEITPEVESMASQISTAFEKLLLDQSQTPQLFNLKMGKIFSTRQGCHDSMEVIKVDPYISEITISLSSSNNHCRINSKYMDYYLNSDLYNIFTKKIITGKYIYDQFKMELKCEMKQKKLICLNKYPDKLFEICPDAVRRTVRKHRPNALPISGLLISEDFQIQSHLAWCTSENQNAYVFMSEEQTYDKSNVPFTITNETINHERSLENDMTGLTVVLKRSIEAQEVQLNEVDE